MQSNHWLFYKISIPVERPLCTLPEGYSFEAWRPGLFRFKASGLPIFPFGVWWIFHMLHVFPNRDYALFIIRRGDRVVHRSVISPRQYRFPFMTADDIQVGDTWTEPAERGRGFARIALEKALEIPSIRKRFCWYIVEPGNQASIRVVEKAGFSLVGRGIRTRRFGLSVLGQFVMTEPTVLAEAVQSLTTGA
jgi:RimJ/RimL family protein N-acetyltransferase